MMISVFFRSAFLLYLFVCLALPYGCTRTSNATMCRQKAGQTFGYVVCSVTNNNLASGKLAMHWWHDANKEPYYTFDNLNATLASQGETLVFAMNGGMYDDRFAPLAYYVEQGHTLKSLNLKEAGGGNFHLLPNGVFWLDQFGKAHVSESNYFAQQSNEKHAAFATQSGPMLVMNNQLHPRFDKDSSSLKKRNGVGICNDGSVKFVISDAWVNFYDFATLFKDTLGCPNALFLDGGRASALYAAELDRNDTKRMGVIIGFSRNGR